MDTRMVIHGCDQSLQIIDLLQDNLGYLPTEAWEQLRKYDHDVRHLKFALRRETCRRPTRQQVQDLRVIAFQLERWYYQLPKTVQYG